MFLGLKFSLIQYVIRMFGALLLHPYKCWNDFYAQKQLLSFLTFVSTEMLLYTHIDFALHGVGKI
jgi:hypothetical protein